MRCARTVSAPPRSRGSRGTTGAGRSRRRGAPSAVSGNVCPVDDVTEAAVVGVAVSPLDVAADGAALVGVGGVVGAVEREVAQAGELRLDAVQPAGVEGDVDDAEAAKAVRRRVAGPFPGRGVSGAHRLTLTLVVLAATLLSGCG